MYISRRVDIIGPPVWKSTISPCLSKSELASLRPWQSECQQHTLSPLHHHTLTPPRYLTMPSCTQNPSDVECDRCSCVYPRIHHCFVILVPGAGMVGDGVRRVQKKARRLKNGRLYQARSAPHEWCIPWYAQEHPKPCHPISRGIWQNFLHAQHLYDTSEPPGEIWQGSD